MDILKQFNQNKTENEVVGIQCIKKLDNYFSEYETIIEKIELDHQAGEVYF